MAPRKKAKVAHRGGDNTPHEGTLSKNTGNSPATRPTRSRNKLKGCLENVQTLPLDVSLEIFGHLHPKDLLNLARTSKAFRSFFLSRANSVSIWKSSLRHVEGLPEKPAFLSEPAFAHLLFDPYCQKCGKSGIHNPAWPWFVRYCTDCIYKSSHYYGLAPKSSRFDPDLVKLVVEQGHALFNIFRTVGPNDVDRIYKPQIKGFARGWKDSGADDGKRSALIEKQKKATQVQAKLAQRFEIWHAAEQRRQSAELEEIQKQRLQAYILERLSSKDSEWLPEMKYFGKAHVDSHIRVNDAPAVQKANPLTNRGWPKVLNMLRKEMETLRARRLLEERGVQMKERLQELKESILDHYVQLPKTAPMDCRPIAPILLGEKECLDLVMAPREQEVTRRDFARVLPEVCSRWEVWCADQLRGSVRTVIPSIPDDVDPLRLAVAVFDCHGVPYSGRTCSGRAAHCYPSLMAHACLCAHPRAHSQEEEDSHISCIAEWLSTSKTDDNKRYRPRSRTKIHQSKCIPLDSIVRMQYIVSSLGLDPSRAMHEEISDAWLWCRVCSPSSREVFTWEAAFLHKHVGHLEERDFWERLGEEDMETVQQLRENGNPPPQDKLKMRWGCTLCRDWDSIGVDVERHLKEKHHIEDWDKCIEDGNLYLHYSQPFPSTHPVDLPTRPSGPARCVIAG